MDLDDLFDPGRGRRKHRHGDHDDHGHRERRYRDHDEHRYERGQRGASDRWTDRHHSHHDDEPFDVSRLAHSLLSHKKLLLLAGAVLLVIIVAVAVFALPWLGQALGYVDKIGLKGVVDRVWQGAGSVP